MDRLNNDETYVVYKITKTQLRHSDIFSLVLGALYCEFRKLYDILKLDRMQLNVTLKVFDAAKDAWYHVLHNPNDNNCSDLIDYSAGFLINDYLKKIIDFITSNKYIDIPKIVAPDFVKYDEIYQEYIKDVVRLSFYEA